MENSLNFVGLLFQTITGLIAVCGLAYVIFRVILPRLQFGQNSSGMIRIVERVGIDAKRSLMVVEVAGKWLLVGVSENGIHLVGELNETEAMSSEAQILLEREAKYQKMEEFRSGFTAKLTSVLGRKEVKNDVNKQPEKKKQFDWTLKK